MATRTLKYLITGILTLYTLPLQADFYFCLDESGATSIQEHECEQGQALIKQTLSPKTEPAIKASSDNATNHKMGAVNLLNNGDFANGLNGWKYTEGAEWVALGGYNHSPGLSIKVNRQRDPESLGEIAVSQCVQLGEGDRYRFSAQVTLDGLSKATYANRINVIWYESIDCRTGGQFGGYVEPKSVLDWQYLTNSDLIPALGARAALISIVQQPRLAQGQGAIWDGIRFEVVETKKKVSTDGNKTSRFPVDDVKVKNGDFSRDLSGWHRMWEVEWVAFEGGNASGAAKVKAKSSAGSIGQLALSQCVDLGPLNKFKLGASFKRDPASTQTGNGRLRITWFENSGCQGRASISVLHVDTGRDGAGWQQIQTPELTVPTGATSGNIEIIMAIDGVGELLMYWDDIRIIDSQP